MLREIYVQEAEKRGLQTSADYRTQMEFARQSILIRSLFADFEKKNGTTEDEARAEYEKFKAGKRLKRGIPCSSHPGGNRRASQGPDRPAQ